jgi:hypothetical protein
MRLQDTIKESWVFYNGSQRLSQYNVITNQSDVFDIAFLDISMPLTNKGLGEDLASCF